jgi:hypothetical protein
MKPHWPTPAGLHRASARLPVEGKLPSFDGATGWLNSPPLTPADLNGKIILVNFIRQPGPIKDRTFDLTFLDSGAQICALTFG